MCSLAISKIINSWNISVNGGAQSFINCKYMIPSINHLRSITKYWPLTGEMLIITFKICRQPINSVDVYVEHIFRKTQLMNDCHYRHANLKCTASLSLSKWMYTAYESSPLWGHEFMSFQPLPIRAVIVIFSCLSPVTSTY